MTRPVPDLPFKLYAIYHGSFHDAELETVTVVRITPTKWWFKAAGARGSSGLAFGCRTGCEPFSYHLSARDAWEQYKADANARITEGQEMLAKANAELGKL